MTNETQSEHKSYFLGGRYVRAPLKCMCCRLRDVKFGTDLCPACRDLIQSSFHKRFWRRTHDTIVAFVLLVLGGVLWFMLYYFLMR
jgi:hypothetical protein